MINTRATQTAITIALEQYFFWTSLTVSNIVVSILMLGFIREYLHNLAIGHIAPAEDTEDGENGYENTSCANPFIYLKSDEKTETDTADHRKTQLHDNGQVFSPVAILFVIKHRIFVYGSGEVDSTPLRVCELHKRNCIC